MELQVIFDEMYQKTSTIQHIKNDLFESIMHITVYLWNVNVSTRNNELAIG